MANNNIHFVEPPVITPTPDGGSFVTMQTDTPMTMGQFFNMMQGMGANQGMMMRVCDACRGSAGQNPKECKCAKCNNSYDLCTACTPNNVDNWCPGGYGCRNVN